MSAMQCILKKATRPGVRPALAWYVRWRRARRVVLIGGGESLCYAASPGKEIRRLRAGRNAITLRESEFECRIEASKV